MIFPTPHLDKINASIVNEKMTAEGAQTLRDAIPVYEKWVADMNAVSGDQETVIQELVTLLNGYKYFIDHDLIFCGESDFLYRQKGQLKLDNSIIEEFMPYLIAKCFPELGDVVLGPTKCFSAAYFRTSLASRRDSSGLSIRTKDQDFCNC